MKGNKTEKCDKINLSRIATAKYHIKFVTPYLSPIENRIKIFVALMTIIAQYVLNHTKTNIS